LMDVTKSVSRFGPPKAGQDGMSTGRSMIRSTVPCGEIHARRPTRTRATQR
jgi:hypothetical protein